ncbi:MAG: HD domain-containing protein [Bacillota bacterium]
MYQRLHKEGSGHDWWHIERVRKNALHIGGYEKANVFVVELAALLHDLIDDKLPENIKLDVSDVESFLLEMGIDEEDIAKVVNIIQVISYRKKTPVSQLTLEAKVVQDADRLDAIGAIGIARTFTFAGSKGNLIYYPNDKDSTDAISHFYDKLLKLKDLMNTSTGMKLAEERHQFLHSFLEQFYNEWNGVK